MTQADLDREVAEKTGESLQTIAERGFMPLTRAPFEREPNRKPLTVDWDQLDQLRCIASLR